MCMKSPNLQELAGLAHPASGQDSYQQLGPSLVRWVWNGIVSITRNDAPQSSKVAQFSGFGRFGGDSSGTRLLAATLSRKNSAV